MPAVSFTGTRKGMTDKQIQSLEGLVVTLIISVLHHGMADGADTQCDEIAHYFGVNTAGHPATGNRKPKCEPDVVFPAKPPLERDRDIAKASDLMIAAPSGYKELRRGSGTWATIRYARQVWSRVIIIWPDGSISGEDNYPDPEFDRLGYRKRR